MGLKVVALCSGGKDSIFSILHCIANGHDVIALAYIDSSTEDKLDSNSFMYQSVGHEVVEAIADCLINPMYDDQTTAPPIPFFRRKTSARAVCQALKYRPPQKEHDEVEDMYILLREIKTTFPEIQAVCSGAILSSYQRFRVENVCQRLGIQSLAYLWNADQAMLLDSMVNYQIEAVLVKVAADSLTKHHLGRPISDLATELKQKSQLYGLNACGEGGEYETIVLDCPLYRRKIHLDKYRIISDGDAAYLLIDEFSLTPKLLPTYTMIQAQLCSHRIYPDVPITCCASTTRHAMRPLRKNKLRIVRPKTIVLPQVNVCGSLFSISAIRTPPCKSGDVATDARNVLDALRQLLIRAKLAFKNILFVNLVLRSMNDFGVVNKIYTSFFDCEPPARACIESSMMTCTLSIDVIGSQVPKKTMHVPSISYWAPANIGPYAQCTSDSSLVCVAGQIGLQPNTMLLPGDFKTEANLALRHLDRIFAAAEGLGPLNYISCVCFVVGKIDQFKLSIIRELWSRRCCLLVIGVSALPRGALVEWLASGACIYDPVPDNLMFRHSMVYCGSTIDYVVSKSARGIFLCGFILCTIDGDITETTLNACRHFILTHMRSLNLLSVRVYYNIESGKDRFEPVLGAWFDPTVTTFVPCLAIDEGADFALHFIAR